MNVHKKIILFGLCFAVLFLTACDNGGSIEENSALPETVTKRAADWLSTRVSNCDVITASEKESEIILLTGIKNPGTTTYAVLRVFVLREDSDSFSVKEVYDGETSVSNGFTAYGFYTEEYTVIFGDTMDSVYDYLNEQRISVEFEKARIYLEDETFIDASVESNSPYLIVLDGNLNITDIEFCSDEFVAKYSMYYSEALIQTTSIEIDDSSNIPNENLEHESSDILVNSDEPIADGENLIQEKTLQYVGDGFQLQIPASGWNYSLYEVAGVDVYCWESEKDTGSSLKVDFFQSGIDVVIGDYRIQGYTIDGNIATHTESNASKVTAFFYELPSGGCWRVVSYDAGGSAEESEMLSAMASSFELS